LQLEIASGNSYKKEIDKISEKGKDTIKEILDTLYPEKQISKPGCA
jgi:hypothetical protein